MDLRSIINTEAGEGAARKQAAPVTPVQTAPQQGFRDYSHPPQASPGKHPSQDYGPGPSPGGSYASPTLYQAQGPYTRPAPPPPIQAPPQNELRSPAGSYTAQSPYRQTPTSAMSSNQYPFPQSHQAPQSPVQHHQYQPSFQSRESYPQSNGPSPRMQQHSLQGHGSPPPQTPPIGIPGSAHPYLQHQRSQSSLSNTTPTSAQSQQQYFPNQYPQESPVSGGQFPPGQLPQHQRQQSQPGTPLGPPINHRQSSSGFTQPTSPYQQRGISAGPFSHYQTSPAPAPSATIPRLPSTPSAYDSQRTSTSDPRLSQSERERSLSVSPKTRLPSQPPRGGISDLHQQPHHQQQQTENRMDTQGKRKMDDREASVTSVAESRRSTQTEGKAEPNGHSRGPSLSTSSPQQPPRKRTRYSEIPVWAQSIKGQKIVTNHSRTNQKPNGKQPARSIPNQVAPPAAIKSETNGHRQMPNSSAPINDPSRILGPWEKTITNRRPQEQITKVVADWLFLNVVQRDDYGELVSRGVEIEIEAKLGQLIDKETNHRIQLPVKTECVLADNGRIAFKSSMTELHHKLLNEFLNARVQETFPTNPEAQSDRRVPIKYLHRREIDKFYELPPSQWASLPPALKAQFKGRHTVKVRVSYDQKTGELLAKIIKARISDLNIHNPQSGLDCRISINFEMRYDGDIEELKSQVTEAPRADRNKDRMSYTQTVYQIDLTQVTQQVTVNAMTRMEKEHELEIEVSTAAIREQAQLAASGHPHEYPALVEGFLDNMRLLANQVKPQ